jgi:hypothetical protein
VTGPSFGTPIPNRPEGIAFNNLSITTWHHNVMLFAESEQMATLSRKRLVANVTEDHTGTRQARVVALWPDWQGRHGL